MSLVRKLPPVTLRNGRTVKFVPELASSVPAETAAILRDKIRTLLQANKAGEIQLVDGPADTVIKCIVTGYEPKIVHSGERQAGLEKQKIVTWIGNIEASVQVLDNRERPIGAAELKYHLENDFVTAKQEETVAGVGDKKTGWRNKVAGVIKTTKGGDTGDVAELAGGGKQIHDALNSGQEKDARPPTELEWRDALIEGMAAKVANQIVPVDQQFVAMLPADKEFEQLRILAKNGHWGEVQEQTEKMAPLQGTKEAYRLYLVGLSYEAIASGEPERPDHATEMLNKASKFYDDAHNLRPDDHELFLAQIRVQDSLDHYLEIQHGIKARETVKTAEPAKSKNQVADNQAVIEMVKANLPESVVVRYVETVANPHFDPSPDGLMEMARAQVSPNIIQAVQQRMTPSTTQSHHAPAAGVKHPVGAH